MAGLASRTFWTTELLYEMLWDCAPCGAKGLLGVSHRHCPQCGAAQDPDKRYFPEHGQEVEARQHRYVGADWACTWCESPNSAAASFCVNCGGPKEGTREVKRVADTVDGAALAPAHVDQDVGPAKLQAVVPGSKAVTGSKRWLAVVAALFLAVLVILGYQLFIKHDETAQLIDKVWTREVDVERFIAQTASAWCDAMPSDAYQVSRSREQRSTRQVPDGQDCHTVRDDMGDGSFSRRQECTPRYRDEPVYDTGCHYRVNRWQVLRTDKLVGNASLAPTWPQPALAGAPGGGLVWVGGAAVLGADRTGNRREAYQVTLQSPKGKQWVCAVYATRWAELAAGKPVTLKVRGTGGAVCDSLVQ